MPKQLYLYVTIICFYSLFIAGEASVFSEDFKTEKAKKELIAQQKYGKNELAKNFKQEKEYQDEKNENPVEITWELLEDIEYVERKYQDYGLVYFPAVSNKLRQLAGKQVQISGFIIPISMEEYAISKNQMASCFFCGGDGPESIIEISFKGKTPQLKTDQYISIQGKFRFNETDPDEWIYFMEEVFIVKK